MIPPVPRGLVPVLLALLASCSEEIAAPPMAPPIAAGGGQELELVALPSPAEDGSRCPGLALGADGQLYLTWVQKLDGGAHALLFSRFDGEGEPASWSEAREIARGENWFVNWVDVPSLAALADGTLLAQFLRRSSGATYHYDVLTTLSGDGGRTWSEPVPLHDDLRPAEHGFVSLVPSRELDRFVAFWLDGRASADAAAANEAAGHGAGDHGAGGHAGAMQLRTRTVARDGQLGPETLLDDRVCDCCPTSAVDLGPGLLCAYRDRSPEEQRDFSLVPWSPAGAGQVSSLSEDGWVIAGCPVNGPALAAAGGSLGAAWFTMGSESRARVLAAFSEDGEVFGEPIVVSEEDPEGAVDAVLRPDGSLWVSWLERVDRDTAEWRLARVGRDGSVDGERVLATTASGRASGVARLVEHGDGALFAWTRTGDAPSVETLWVRPPAR